ncbi:MAG: hypothetical protein WCH04_18330, partial [Gammaproteobacteria bacterium]
MIDLSRIGEILESVETNRSFESLAEHKSRLHGKNMSYEDLLDYAALYSSWCELLEFENENLKKILDAMERIVFSERELCATQKANHDQLIKILELHELVTTTGRFLEGQIKGRDTQKKMHGVKAANARHSKPGGSRERVQQMRAFWASGKYSSRDICTEQE